MVIIFLFERERERERETKRKLLTAYNKPVQLYTMASSPEIPKKYKAVVYDAPGSISTKIETLDMPEPGAGEVLVNLTHSGVCHSDLGVMINTWKTLPFPTQAGQVGGHEGVGKIVKMGPGTDNAAVKIGDRVGIKWMAGICESCEACRAGIDASCFSGVSFPTFFIAFVLRLFLETGEEGDSTIKTTVVFILLYTRYTDQMG